MQIEWSWSRGLSLAWCVGYFGFHYLTGATSGDLVLILGWYIVPMTLIWFPDAIGGYTGFAGARPLITKETPGCIVAFLGWALLFAPWWYPALIRLIQGEL